MVPVPESAGDIRAQLAAVMDPHHPKRACLVMPEDHGQIPYVLNAHYATRPEGTLVTTFAPAALMFEAAEAGEAFDRTMAVLLGIPEDKHSVAQRCDGRPELYSRSVQARDAEGNVISEAFASPQGLHATVVALEGHVPPDGALVIMKPVDAISRRIATRCAGE